MKANVLIRLNEDVLDAGGRILRQRLIELGFTELRDARIGKVVELDLETSDKDSARERIQKMCELLLVNGDVENAITLFE